MKKMRVLVLAFSSLIALDSGFCAGSNSAGAKSATDKKVYIEVKSTKLKVKPEYLAANLADLAYGAALNVVNESADKSGWVKVSTTAGVSGYVHLSALSTRRVVLSGSSDKKLLRSGESPKDIVMAGKGFSKEVEKEFAAKNPALNFSAVNAMEKLRVGEGEIRAFAKAGGLLKGGKS